ncbi:ADP-ribosyltransferase [Mycobacterium kubicae]|uniref:ADP-ribosyltransferase n=1 Tax=Mycobacterium kubicae TaxID=120959 RepID=UPI0031451FC2
MRLAAHSEPTVRLSAHSRRWPAAVITERGFLSATKDPTVAQSSTFAGNVEFKIFASTGRDITSISLHPGEQEVLFPAGTKFYVIGKSQDPVTGRTIIEMIEPCCSFV